VRALLRRAHDGGGGGEKTVLHIGNLEVNLLGHNAKVGATALDLTPKEFRLLSILVREPGKVWSKFKLLDQVWQVNLELESNVVESTVRNIRRKLEQAGCSAAIESKRNLGYWIEA
jgi:two-component system copper resistance phosphate regulon response regulator CusR